LIGVVLGVTGFWLKLQATPVGAVGQLSVIGEVNPLTPVMVRVIGLEAWPALTLALAGLAVSVNGDVTVTVAAVEVEFASVSLPL
jgi:hypothetical protein